MVAKLGTDIADPARRLEAVRASTHQSKAYSEATGARSMAELAEFMPGGLAALAARAASRFEMATRGEPAVNCVVSNVPGPQVPLYFAGARLEFFFGGAAVVDGMALLHGVTSYCGEVVRVRRLRPRRPARPGGLRRVPRPVVRRSQRGDLLTTRPHQRRHRATSSGRTRLGEQATGVIELVARTGEAHDHGRGAGVGELTEAADDVVGRAGEGVLVHEARRSPGRRSSTATRSPSCGRRRGPRARTPR